MIITGTGFVSGLTVTFGGVSATSIVVVSQFKITCLTPAHAVGAVNVVVTNPDGQAATLTNGFSYSETWENPTDPKGGILVDTPSIPTPTTSTPPGPTPPWVRVDPIAPTLIDVEPQFGTNAGGTKVVVIGSDFVNGATVKFAGTLGINTRYINSEALLSTTPAHAIGAVSVVVTNPNGKLATLANGYTYKLPARTLASVRPTTGTTLGGTAITVQGTGFVTPVVVSLDGLTASSPVVVNSQTVTAVTTPSFKGDVDVDVENTN